MLDVLDFPKPRCSVTVLEVSQWRCAPRVFVETEVDRGGERGYGLSISGMAPAMVGGVFAAKR
jgi:hypothetical protein